MGRNGVPDDRKTRSKRTYERNKNLIRSLKAKPCKRCKGRFPYYVMEFDHVRGKKKCNMNALRRPGATVKMITAEAAKCDVVCSNCHKIRGHLRRLRENRN